jgi:pSer/pThr/pTyr-binding forkhead associated (FHA) protein
VIGNTRSAEAPVAKLIVKDGDQTYLLDLAPGESLSLGRSHDCDISIEAPRASRRHASFDAADEGHTITDLASTNGTLLNGAPLAGRAPLADGDVVDAAGCIVVYRTLP